MEIIKNGFTLNFNVQAMDLIKVGGSGTMDNGNTYPASVKIRTTNIIQVEDEELGLVDKEELLEFRIICETNSEAGELNKLFRSLKSNGVVLNLTGSLPQKYSNSEYLRVNVFDTPQNLIQKYHKDMKKVS